MNYPLPLTAKDEGSFAYLSVKDRMPVIITNIIDDLCRRKYEFISTYGEECTVELKVVIGKLSALKNEIQTNKELSDIAISNNSCNDDKFWQAYFNDYRNIHNEYPKWFDAEWLSVECFMYRKIDDIFKQSKKFSSFDPFENLKMKTISDYNKFIIPLLKYVNEIISDTSSTDIRNYVHTLTGVSLWGNQCDLSLTTTESLKGVESIEESINAKTPNLLVWEFDNFWNYLRLRQNKQTELAIVLDNAGVELICDLCLLTVLMKYEYCSSVTFYPKIRPYFVSDTTIRDLEYVLRNIGLLCPEGNALGQLWTSYFKQGKWTIIEDPFWTAPYTYSTLAEFNPQLYEQLSQHSLLIFKGDLNYRKLTGDLAWPIDTPFKESLRGFIPTNLLVLRTIKGGPVTGLDKSHPSVVEALRIDDWLSGAFGMCHFVNSISSDSNLSA